MAGIKHEAGASERVTAVSLARRWNNEVGGQEIRAKRRGKAFEQR